MPRNKEGIEAGTAAEQAEVKRRLKKRYGDNWVSTLKTKVGRELAGRKKKDTVRTKDVTSGLKNAGVDDSMIKKLRGSK